MDAWDSTPRIAFLSAEPAREKPEPGDHGIVGPYAVSAVNVSPAYLFRKVGREEGPRRSCYDEIDTVFGPKAKENEEIRGLLNAGHRRGAVRRPLCRSWQDRRDRGDIGISRSRARAGLAGCLIRSCRARLSSECVAVIQGETVEPFRRRIHYADGAMVRGLIEHGRKNTLARSNGRNCL